MPTTRSRGKPLVSIATWHIASSGLATTMRIVSGECFTTSPVTLPTMSWFVLSRSSAHPRLTGAAAGYDDHVRARGLLITVGACYPGVVADDRAALEDVERLALG